MLRRILPKSRRALKLRMNLLPLLLLAALVTVWRRRVMAGRRPAVSQSQRN
ncbi:hypothetical protein HNR42_000662 [Deinobacterium chartae]|uniref:Uncharacterized protein n=1 Tax=Deinobacterium chartae TaxID=521158 RepID=A0A841HZ40_9DEIO|nr:hypothetical protein [Deinobacterium chartae]MBB6097248.1 hypothetical protein [Deinobacterium chartae]